MGKFFLKDAYEVLVHQRIQNPYSLEKFWKAPIHERHKSLLWKVAKCLSIKEKLNTFMNFNDLYFYLCGKVVEGVEHLFIWCKFLQSWWFNYNWNIIWNFTKKVDVMSYLSFILNPSSKWLTKMINKRDFTFATVIMIEQILWLKNEIMYKNKTINH